MSYSTIKTKNLAPFSGSVDGDVFITAKIYGGPFFGMGFQAAFASVGVTMKLKDILSRYEDDKALAKLYWLEIKAVTAAYADFKSRLAPITKGDFLVTDNFEYIVDRIRFVYQAGRVPTIIVILSVI